MYPVCFGGLGRTTADFIWRLTSRRGTWYFRHGWGTQVEPPTYKSVNNNYYHMIGLIGNLAKLYTPASTCSN